MWQSIVPTLPRVQHKWRTNPHPTLSRSGRGSTHMPKSGPLYLANRCSRYASRTPQLRAMVASGGQAGVSPCYGIACPQYPYEVCSVKSGRSGDSLPIVGATLYRGSARRTSCSSLLVLRYRIAIASVVIAEAMRRPATAPSIPQRATDASPTLTVETVVRT